jgi:hypothetical protein
MDTTFTDQQIDKYLSERKMLRTNTEEKSGKKKKHVSRPIQLFHKSLGFMDIIFFLNSRGVGLWVLRPLLAYCTSPG